MRKFFAFFFLFAAVFAGVAFAQTTTPSLSPTGTTGSLTFPIAELGNCASAKDCKAYCDDPIHVDACVAYAKEKGFYHQSTLDTDQETILADAKATLGCDSVDSCKTFCADPANATVCSNFAQKHHLQGGNQQLSNTTLQKAEQAFGCTSIDSCRAFCENPQNKAQCTAFAAANGLKGGNSTTGPGGCTSEDSCKAFCSIPDNFQTCSQFMQSHQSSVTGSPQHSFTGPGGCTSEDSCKTFCMEHPNSCHTSPLLSPTTSLSPIPTRMDPAEYCRMYPSHCAVTPTGQPTPLPPGSAQQTTPLSPNPTYAVLCANQGNGCFLSGTHCVCPTPQVIPTGTTLTPSPTRLPTPTIGTGFSTPTPTFTPTVKGASTQINLWDWLLHSFFGIR